MGKRWIVFQIIIIISMQLFYTFLFNYYLNYFYASEGIQIIPQWHKNDFELKTFENQQMQKEALSEPSLI